MKRATRLSGGAAVAIAALSAACHGSARSTDPGTTGASEATLPPTPPVDHLAPGELLEGSDEAFGLTLPRGVRVDEAFTEVVYASGALAVHPVVSYLRSRLVGGDLREGETSATFEGVTVPGHSERLLRIHVAEVRRSAMIDIRDTTPGPRLNLPDEPARWKHVGLTPNGRIADPTHLD